MACYFDARDWIKWSTITISMTCSGSYSFTDNGGVDAYSGTISGTSTLVLSRKTFDKTIAPDYGQITGPNDFVTFRKRRGCPYFINATSLYGAGEGSTGEIEISTTEPSGTVVESELSNHDLFLLLPDSVAVEGSCDCGDPETIVFQATAAALLPPNDYFMPFGDIADGITDVVVDWLTGGSFLRNIDYDIYSPPTADIPNAICGSGSTVMEVTFAV